MSNAQTPAPQPRPTIRTVAARANVSKSLVSLVLRDAPGVSAEKREAVLRAMDELGYHPNAQARALSENTTRAIGVLVDDLRDPWYMTAIEGISSALRNTGLEMWLGDQHLDILGGESLTRTFSDMRLQGAILTGSLVYTDALARLSQEMPSVVISNSGSYGKESDIVMNDDVEGARIAVEYLLRMGHQNIAHLSNPESAPGRSRERGYRLAMEEAGLQGTIQVQPSLLSEDAGYRTAVRLLTGRPRPTALFCYNDLIALGALSAATDVGLDVPDAVSIVGYDNSLLSSLRHTNLTTIDPAGFAVGRKAAELLLERINGLRTEPVNVILPPALIPRGTVGEHTQ